jgi:hypothetical protein
VNYDLVLRGVEQVFLSDSQKVYIYPDNDEIVLKKGLDITFSGNVSAGLLIFMHTIVLLNMILSN